MNSMKWILLWIMVCSMVMMSGCSPFSENNKIEEIAPVVFWSMDEGEAGKLKISTLAPPLINEKKRLLTRQVDLLLQAQKGFNLTYYRELKTGQLRMLLISEKLAKKGIGPILNLWATSPDISQRLYLVVVKGSVEDYIKNQLVKQPNLDYFLYRMLRHYESDNQGEITVVNLHQVVKKLYSTFPDPILPVFQVDKNTFAYEGTAFFHQDKLIATVKNTDDLIVQLLNNNHYLKYLPISSLLTSLGHVRSEVHMKLKEDYSSVSIQVKLNGRIEEYLGNKNITNQDELTNLHNEMESYLEKQTTELLKKMQKWNVDPLQIGTLSIKPFGKPLSDKQWSSYWKKMKIKVDYQLQIEPLTNVNK